MSILRVGTLIAIVLLLPARAYAYIDPGSGSVIFQVIIGGLLAVGVTLKMYWGRVVQLFRGGRDTDDATPDDKGTR